MKKILVFTASWCGPCKSYKPLMEKLSTEYPVEFIDIDSNPSLTTQYNIRSVPTTVIVEGNTEINRKAGMLMENQVRELFN